MGKIRTSLFFLMVLFFNPGCRKESTVQNLPTVSVNFINGQNQADYLTSSHAGKYVVSGTYWIGGNGIVNGVISEDTILISPVSVTNVSFKAGFKELLAANACFGDSANCKLSMATADSLNSTGIFVNYYFFGQTSSFPVYYSDDAGWKVYFPKNNSDSIYITISDMSCSCYPIINLSGVKMH